MKTFKQFNEALSHNWIEAGKKMKEIHPDLQKHFSNMNLQAAAHIYKNVLGQGGRNAVDTALKSQSHYHDIHNEFQDAVKKYEPPKKEEAAPEETPGTREHFVTTAKRFFGHSYSEDKTQFDKHHDELALHYTLKGSIHKNGSIHDRIMEIGGRHYDQDHDGTPKRSHPNGLEDFKKDLGHLYDHHKSHGNFIL